MLTAKVNRGSWASRRNSNSKNWFSDRVARMFRWLRGKTAKRIGIVGGLVVGCGNVLYCLNRSVEALELHISIPSFPWTYNKPIKAFDHATLRRGWVVYRTICYACHSLQYVRFMDLVDETHSEDEAKAIAAEYEVQDGPDENGEYYNRPCKLSDAIPSPYPNEEAARAANGGAYPPDLSQMVFGRLRNIDYVFSMLTGYLDPPAGIKPEEGQNFNIYFDGGFTSMPKPINQGALEYEDGTPATESQMAKDVVEFLTWTASPEHDLRKLMMIKATGVFLLLIAVSGHVYRRYWSIMKTQRIAYVPHTKFADAPPPIPVGSRDFRPKKNR